MHGIGNQGERRPDDSAKPTYSADLRKYIRRKTGASTFDKNISWREIFWADILLPNQMRYLDAIKNKVNYNRLREFILCNIADAASYQRNAGTGNNAYKAIHERISTTIQELEQDVETGAPLLILTHSFGAHIISNYIWDIQNQLEQRATPFQRLESMAGLITFGANIPLFLFGIAPEDIRPIRFPGTALANEDRVLPWWQNYYDPDDVMAYPLRQIGPAYAEMIEGNEINEHSINVGGLFTSWNPASHDQYWKDRNFYRPATEFIKQFL